MEENRMGMGSERNGGPVVQGLVGGLGPLEEGHEPTHLSGSQGHCQVAKYLAQGGTFLIQPGPGGLCMAPSIISQERVLSC